MKNLMIYINPRKDFDEEGKIAVKIQIDNSLSLGWIPEDIILVTNFPYQYQGVKAIVVDDLNFCTFCPAASKINVICDLFKQKLIKKEVVYWFHDLDAYQCTNIVEPDLDFDKADLLLPDFGRLPKWSTGSFFFKASSEDIFNWVKEIMDKHQIDEEGAFCILTGLGYPISLNKSVQIKGYTAKDHPEIKNIAERIKRLNISYNFHSFNVRSNYNAALKPIKVVHFHFIEKTPNPLNPRPNQIDFFLYGNNKINVQFMPVGLVEIFKKHATH